MTHKINEQSWGLEVDRQTVLYTSKSNVINNNMHIYLVDKCENEQTKII